MKTILKLFLINILIIQQAFALVNPLLNSKDSTIVDIGSTDIVPKPGAEYNKIVKSIPALYTVVDNVVEITNRLIDTAQCETDQYGHEGCTLDEKTCEANVVYGDDIATKHYGSVTTQKIDNSINIVLPANFPSFKYGIAWVWPSFLKTYGVANGRYERQFYAPVNGNYTLKFEVDNVGSIRLGSYQAIDSLNSSNWGKIWTKTYYFDKGYHVISISTGGDHATDGFAAVIYDPSGKILWDTRHGQNKTITEYVCPNGYYDPLNNTKINGFCQKDYIFYTYECPTDLDEYENAWQGPMVSTGGDCRGLGVPEAKGGVCPNQPANGFDENCIRYDQKCPYGDDIDCVAKAMTDDSYLDGTIKENKVYSLANTKTFSGLVAQTMKCPNEEALKDLEPACPPSWDIEGDLCYKPATDYKIEPTDGYDLEYQGKYFKTEPYAFRIIEDNGDYKYETSATKGLDYGLNACVVSAETKCLNEDYIFDETINACVYKTVCNQEYEGSCYVEPHMECKTGFVFNNDRKKCEKQSECVGDRYIEYDSTTETFTEKCLSFDTLFCSNDNLEFDTVIPGTCAANIDLKDPICEPGYIVKDKKCIKEMYSNDLEKLSTWYRAGADSKWYFYDNGTQGFQTVNTAYPTYLINPVSLNNKSEISGKLRMEDSDDDWVGLVFGYIDNNNYYRFTWHTTGGGNSNSGWDLTQIKNGKYITLASNIVGGSRNGYKRDTTYLYTLKYEPGKIEGFINNRKVITYTNPNFNINGKAGFYGYSQKNTRYWDFSMKSISEKKPTCEEGYLLNLEYFICYKDLGEGVSYDFDTGIATQTPSCTIGSWDFEKKGCVSNPSCSLGDVYIDVNGNGYCQIDPEFNCNNQDNLTYRSDIPDIFMTDNLYLKGGCEVINPCKENEETTLINGELFCKPKEGYSNVVSTCPESYVLLDKNDMNSSCVALPTCPIGYVDEGNQCVLHYNWYEYYCDEGWDGPNEIFVEGDYKAGGNCYGSCGMDGCDCNSPISPANSCSKSISTAEETHYVMLKKDMKYHNVSGNTLGANDMNNVRNYACSDNLDDCIEGLNRIYGIGNNLCFEKKNGDKSCLTVDECYFSGEIGPSSADPEELITGLKLIDPYTMTGTTNFEMPKISYEENYDLTAPDITKTVCEDDTSYWYAFNDGNGNIILRLSTGTHNCGGSGYYDFAKFVDVPEYQTGIIKFYYSAGCLGSANVTDEVFDTASVGNWLKVRSASSCTASGAQHPTVSVKNIKLELEITKYTCPEGYYDPQNDEFSDGICFKNVRDSADGKIISTCKMNGHVGWTGRNGPITSVGNDIVTGNSISFKVYGNADLGEGTSWEGFNAATTALLFSDGNWYVSANALSSSGSEVNRDLPTGVKLLNNANYVITKSSLYSGECKYKNTVLDSDLCGDDVKILSPGTNLYLIGMTDIESLSALYTGRYENGTVEDNNINLRIEVKDKTFYVNKLGAWSPATSFDESLSDTVIDPSFTRVNNRIRFWDSYLDGSIGFIEFVNEVYPEDREEGYVPEYFDYEELLGDGFTSIFLLTENDAYLSEEDMLSKAYTYAVRTLPTSAESCVIFAEKYGADVINADSFNTIEYEKLVKSLGIKDRYACVIALPGVKIPANSKKAVLIKTYTGERQYVCSPYVCVDNQCAKATCQTGYEGNVLPDIFAAEDTDTCIDQVCDANKDYVEVCGKEGGCPADTYNDNGTCKQPYCEEGILDTATNSCLIETCPPTTYLSDDGTCQPE